MELDKPTLQDDGFYLVHTTGDAGNVVKVKFKEPAVKPELKESPTDKTLPIYWIAKMSETKFIDFKQKSFIDFSTKKIRSVRDGVQEYAGIELGLEPAHKIFKVYRSPETITKIVAGMDNLPIIDDHIPADQPVKESEKVGIITDTEIVEFSDTGYDASLVLENKAKVTDEVLKLVKAGKRELSLGYMAKLVPHDVYDFEQIEIKPRHLAIVDAARGGSALKFLDKDGKRMELEKMLFLASQISELLKKSTAEELADYVPFFEKVAGKVTEEKKDETEGMESKEEKEEVADMKEEEVVEDEKEVEDMDEKEKEVEDEDKEKALEDSAEKIAQRYIATIEKAKTFLDSSFTYAGKKELEIKQAVLDACGIKVEASEVDIAFKIVKKSDKYNNFGDNKKEETVDVWASLEGKEF